MSLFFFLFSSWYATVLTQHIWYNEQSTTGDILINEVSIQNTAVNTYYETLGWNQGGLAGGYTGIQHTSNGNVFIYSLWDPSLTVQVTSVVYSEPNSVTERFGGEGTGYHFLTRPALGGTSWKLNTWYTLLTRCWNHGTHTYYGLWVFDSVNWRYLVTIDYPYSGSRFNYGAMSFLENYAGTGLSLLRKMSTRNGWKRYSNGQWSAFTKGSFDKNSVGGVSGNNFYMATQSGLPNTITTNTVQQVPSPSTTTPVYPALSVTSFSAVYDVSTQKVTISWVVDTTRSPQFSYSVNIYLEASTTSALTSADSAPQIRSVELNLQGLAMGTYKVSLIVVDVFDVASSEQVRSFSRFPAQSVSPTRLPSAVPVSTYNPTTRKPTSKPTTNKPGTRQPTAKVTTVKPTTIQPSLSSGFPTSSSAAALSIVGPLSFDGVKSYYGYGSFKPSLGSAFTLSMWITQAATSSTDQYLACLGRTPKNYVGEFILQVLSNNVVKYWEYGSNGYGISVTSSSIIALGKRTHVALVRNGLQGTLYLNSVVDISGTSTLASAVTFMNANFTLGKNIREGSSYFKGSMDRVEVYSNALTQTQITSLYNSYKV